MFIDAHAHLYELKDVEKVLERSKEALVESVICPASDFKTSRQAAKLAKKFENVYACVGFHPEEAEKFDKKSIKRLRKLCKNKKVIAIGEIGLDYHYAKNAELQKEVFEKQLSLASELSLPVVVHIRDAMDDALAILEKNRHLLCGGIVHCFGGDVKDAEKIFDLGLLITIGGVCTFKNSVAFCEVLSRLPIEKIMLETDSPFLSPHPYRGKINEPKNIPIIAQKIGQLHNVSAEEVGKITSENVRRVFKI